MKIAILDIETTGFLQKGGKIVEIGIVELDLEDGSVEVLFDQVTHEHGITKEEVEDSWIVKNSSLTVEEVRHSKRLDHYREELQPIFDKYYVTAYNKSFDFGFLRDRGFLINKELDCPMKVATNICKLPGKFDNYKWPKVEEAIHHFFPEKVDYVEAHRGCSDAIDEAQIVYKLYKLGEFEIPDELRITPDPGETTQKEALKNLAPNE